MACFFASSVFFVALGPCSGMWQGGDNTHNLVALGVFFLPVGYIPTRDTPPPPPIRLCSSN